MSIEVRIPTVLRKHTDGEKKVSGSGTTLRELGDAKLASSAAAVGIGGQADLIHFCHLPSARLK